MAVALPKPPPPHSDDPTTLLRVRTTAPHRLFLDRLGRRVVGAGGMAIIASILGILLFIVLEVVPLMRGARVTARPPLAVAQIGEGVVIGDEHREFGAHLGPDGMLRIVSFRRRGAESGAVDVRPLLTRADGAVETFTAVEVVPGSEVLLAATHDGRVLIEPVAFDVHFEGAKRVVEPRIVGGQELQVDERARPFTVFTGTTTESGSAIAAALLPEGKIALVRKQSTTNEFSGEVSETMDSRLIDAPAGVTTLLMDRAGTNLYAGTAQGQLLWWRLERDGVAPVITAATDSPITALSLLIGHRALIVGEGNGALSIWFPLRSEAGRERLARVRDFPRSGGAIQEIAPSRRDKSFLAASADGKVGLYHSTAHRQLWREASPGSPVTGLFFSPKNDAAIVASAGQLAELAIDNPHGDISLTALFGPVWYEGYERSEFVWQSSSGTDDFEPKMSLTPLLIGTLKGTVYSLLLAIPLGVFGAMYTSQFMHHSLKRFIKPTVEIMAALPSVVLGFLAGLWLAPRLEQAFPALVLMAVFLPAAALAAGWTYGRLPLSLRGRWPAGSEVFVGMLFLAFGAWLALQFQGPVESALFGGRIQTWLLEVLGLHYDQRNAVVVGLAMGFAVIPIIFTVSEEAFSNVPQNLISGSLALGANRWQTVTQIVLPSASPGIFSAIMIGFGRAIGETMIVLMATGNTPIMDFSPFNGFRTLSANIAVEIPEAPWSGTLYRTLFLAGLLLFVLTFAVNTAAEVVRQNLRRRFSNL